MMSVKEVRWKLEYLVFRTVGCLFELLTPRQTRRLAELFAWVMTRVLPKKLTRYHVSYENIQLAYGGSLEPQQIDKLIFGMWVHLFRMIAEMIQFPRKCHLETHREVFVFRQNEETVKAVMKGRPVIFVGGHFGNWEASTTIFGQFLMPLGVVGRKLDNPYLDAWVKKTRESTGHQLLMKDGGWDGMVRILENKGTLALLGDQDAGKRGVFVDFFGRPASTYRSVALMAIEHQAIIVVGYGRRLPDDFDNCRWTRFEIGCEEIIDVTEIEKGNEVFEISQRYSQALERIIRRDPDQYFWVHRRWKSQPRVRNSGADRKVA
jgi:KDO2-lipid IV(A) lauroyltransferase